MGAAATMENSFFGRLNYSLRLLHRYLERPAPGDPGRLDPGVAASRSGDSIHKRFNIFELDSTVDK